MIIYFFLPLHFVLKLGNGVWVERGGVREVSHKNHANEVRD